MKLRKSLAAIVKRPRIERLELMQAIVRGLEASQAGRLVDNEEVLRRLRKIAGA